jgi:hypothetical protein
VNLLFYGAQRRLAHPGFWRTSAPGSAEHRARLAHARSLHWLVPGGEFLFLFFLILAALPTPLGAQPTSETTPEAAASTLEELKEKIEGETAKKQARPTRWGEPTEVQVGIYVIDVDEVNSASQNFSASIFYEIRWKNPLLKHDGPGPKVQRATSVWTPRFVLVNQQQAWTAFPDFVEIQPDGEVILRQKVWGWFSQPLQLADFPFDRQKITFHLASAGITESQAKVTKLKKTYRKEFSRISSNFSIPDFEVEKWHAGSRAYYPTEGEAGVAGFIMEIDLKRKPSYFIWKVILPLCLIVVMSWVPRWLDPKDSGTSVGISATAFLTLVAYLFAINLLLPRVSYLTRLDSFILLSTFLVFLGLMHTVLSTYFTSNGQLERVLYVNRTSRWVYPLLLLLIIAISFGGVVYR